METPQTETKKPVPPKAKPEPPPMPSVPQFDWSKPVPVAVIRFDRGVDVPGKMNENYLKSTSAADRAARPDGDIFDVEYIAAIRHFRVTYTSKGKRKVGVAFIPEGRALSWEPVA